MIRFATAIACLVVSSIAAASVVSDDAVSTETPAAVTPVPAGWSGRRAWRAPDYAGQHDIAGYRDTTFAVPVGLEKQVQFWVDVYTKYTSSQGVIHDVDNVEIVYEILDLRDVDALTGLTPRAKEKLRQKTIDEAKERAQALLRKLERTDDPDSLNMRERRIWNAFQRVEGNGRLKFREAADMSRLRFQGGLRDRMAEAIYVSGRYIEDFEKIFRENGLPIELTRLVFVESSFNVLARSKVGASGLWQLMPGAVRPYKMISPAVDLRNHPLSATRVAARMLKDNYRMLESWPLAVMGYNHGPTGVRKMVENYGTRDISLLIRNGSRRNFGFASRNFYPSFLAALEVERTAPKHFPGIAWSRPLAVDEIKLPQAVKYRDLLSWHGGDEEKTQICNPHLTRKVSHFNHAIPAGTPVAMPLDQINRALAMLGQVRVKHAVAASSATKPAPVARAPRSARSSVYRVGKGDTLTGIAKSFGVALSDLVAENNLKAGRAIWPGQRLRIP